MNEIEQPYRIGTDSLPEWRIRAKSRGPIRPRTLTVKTQTGTAPAMTPEQAHRIAATQLAEKIAKRPVRVEIASHDGGGNRYDWKVYA